MPHLFPKWLLLFPLVLFFVACVCHAAALDWDGVYKDLVLGALSNILMWYVYRQELKHGKRLP